MKRQQDSAEEQKNIGRKKNSVFMKARREGFRKVGHRANDRDGGVRD